MTIAKTLIYAQFFSRMTLSVTMLYLVTIALSDGQIQDITTEFEAGKAVATSHTTIQPYSKIQCVKKCYEEGKKDRCNVAGYNKETKSCHLSVDMRHEVLDVADAGAGVYIFPKGWFSLSTAYFTWNTYYN